MDEAHAPLLEVAAELLDHGGDVLDLGCGNAMLLKKVWERSGKRATPFGIDVHRERVAHARTVLPDFAANFRIGDMRAAEELTALRRHYRLVMLSINRLLEVSEARARQIIGEIRQWSDFLLVYQYPASGSVSDLAALADRFGLRVTIRTPLVVVAEGRSE